MQPEPSPQPMEDENQEENNFDVLEEEEEGRGGLEFEEGTDPIALFHELEKKGRKKGSRKKMSPEVSMKLGEATLYYASGEYKKAIPILHEVIRLAPNLSDGYYLLSKIHDCLNDRKKAFNFCMIAAFLAPKDGSLWRKLVSRSIELGDPTLYKHCLTKAVVADQENVKLKFDLAFLYSEAGEVSKAAEMYEMILGVEPENVQARKLASKVK